MKRTFLIIIVITTFSVSQIKAQKILTLKECYDQAYKTSVISGEASVYTEISKLKEENLLKAWFPALDAGGSFLYNSSVLDMGGILGSLPFPGIADAIKPLPHEQYKITVDINQVIYDGGAAKGARELEKADLNINKKQAETDLYKLRGQINSYYFGILLLDRQKALLDSHLQIISKKIASLRSGVENGMIIRSDADILTSEKIKIEQQITENNIRKTSLIKVLSDLTGIKINDSSEFLMTPITSSTSVNLHRPDLELFDLRKEQLDAGMRIVDSKRMPKAIGFATIGYGNPPGSNFFKNEFAPYYVMGATVKWNIFDWSRSKNEKRIISYQQSIIEARKKDLTDNLKRLLESKSAEIASLSTMIESDSELIALRKRISASAESQYQNGMISATEYLNELNSERQTLITSEIHKLNLTMAKVEYLNISGQDIQ